MYNIRTTFVTWLWAYNFYEGYYRLSEMLYTKGILQCTHLEDIKCVDGSSWPVSSHLLHLAHTNKRTAMGQACFKAWGKAVSKTTT